MSIEIYEKELEARARRAAARAGYVARKSRWRAGSPDNHGEFMLVDPDTNCVVTGSKFDMTASELLDYLAS